MAVNDRLRRNSMNSNCPSDSLGRLLKEITECFDKLSMNGNRSIV